MRIIVWNEPKSKYWKFLGFHLTHGTHFLDALAKVLGCGGRESAWEIPSPLLAAWMQLVAGIWGKLHLRGAVMNRLCLLGIKTIFWLSRPLALPPFLTSDAEYTNGKLTSTIQIYIHIWRLDHNFAENVPQHGPLLTFPTYSFQGLLFLILHFTAEHPCLQQATEVKHITKQALQFIH